MKTKSNRKYSSLKKTSGKASELADISNQKTRWPSSINEVGLSNIELPLKVFFGRKTQVVLGQVSAFVSLDNPQQRGIHMSRIYQALHGFSEKEILNLKSLKKLAKHIVNLQKPHSHSGRLLIHWKGALEQKSLSSSRKGWRVYPCFYETVYSEKNSSLKKPSKSKNQGTKKDHTQVIMGFELLYSSTCPCSAALSRELIQENFKKSKNVSSRNNFIEWLGQESSIAGTPHAQRSKALISIKTEEEKDLFFLIKELEQVLSTPVQTAVKREDEKHFALMNGKNLMYSEDAVRKIKKYLESQKWVQGYSAEVCHLESLHPFDTTARVMKNW